MRRTTGRRLTALVSAALLACLAAPAAASGDRDRWIVRGAGLWITTTGDAVAVERPEVAPNARVTIDVGGGSGFALDVEYLVTRRLGVELGLFAADLDLDLGLDPGLELPTAAFTFGEELSFEAVALGLDLHLTPGSRVDLSVGGFVAQSFVDDVVVTVPFTGEEEKLTFDDDYGFGVVAGVDAPFTAESPWLVSARVRYLVTVLESDSGHADVDLDPFFVSLGVGFRW